MNTTNTTPSDRSATDATAAAVAEALAALLADACPPEAVRAIDAGGPHAALWRAIDSAGFADAMLPEDAGGAGLPLDGVFELLLLCGRHALPLPLADTLLGRALLAEAGLPRPAGSLTLATGRLAADGGVTAVAVPHGRVADHALVQVSAFNAETRVLLLACADAGPRTPTGHVLDADLAWPAAAVQAAPRLDAAPDLVLLQALLAAVQMAGAMRSVLDLTLAYTQQRQQFGQAIARFQAIQHQLAQMAEEALAARMAARLACRSASASALVPDALRIAVAKARCSEAAVGLTGMGHALHGAIGVTAAYDLQLHTRRLHRWRLLAGAEGHWQQVLGRQLVGGAGASFTLIRTLSGESPAPA